MAKSLKTTAPKKSKSEMISVYNRSNQMIPLQLRAPGGDFYLSEQTIYIKPNKSVTIPKSYANDDQIVNLQKRGMIKIIYDSESAK